MDQEKSQALFIPSAISRDLDLNDLPIGPFDRGSLAGDIVRQQKSASCIVRPGRDRQGSAPETVDLPQMFVLPDVVFVGRVVEVVDGWNNWRHVIGRMAYTEITEVIHPADFDDRYRPGRTLAVFFEGGSSTISGVDLCFEPGNGAHRPEVGDRLLVGGKTWGGDERHFNAFVKFPVVAGRVLPQPYPELRADARSWSVRELRQEIRRSARRNPD